MFGQKNANPADIELFVIYDSKVQAYETPSFAINEHDLVRQVINMFQDPQQKNNRYLLNAEDYSIFKIGGFYKKSGELKATNVTHVANMHDLRAAAQEKGIAAT